MIIHNSRKYLEQLTPMKIDVNTIKTAIGESKTKMLSRFDDFEKYLLSSISSIKESMSAVFTKILEQVDLKTGSN